MNTTSTTSPASLFRRLAALTVLACVASSAHATIIASDTFSITDTRPVGSTIIGSTTEIGGLAWNGGNAAWVTAGDTTNGYAARSGSSAARSLALPFSFSNYTEDGDVATISVSLKSSKGSNSSYWFLIAFGNSATGGNPTGNGLIYLRLNPYDDAWGLYSKGTLLTYADTTPVSGSLSAALGTSYDEGSFYTYSLSYDNATNTVTDVTINGTSVVSSYVLSASPGAITTASFFGQYVNAATQLDSFTLSVNPTAVPEPAAYALIAGLASFGFLWLRRRKRA